MAKAIKAKVKAKGKAQIKMDAGAEKKKGPVLKITPLPLPPVPHNGEYTVDFNKYIVVYSNNFDRNLSSMWRAGCTSIDCYKDAEFVGVIAFYETVENMDGGYVDANGVVVVEYPIEEFENIMLMLRTFTQLSLLFVERDNAGVPLAHPTGAVMTFQHKSIGS